TESSEDKATSSNKTPKTTDAPVVSDEESNEGKADEKDKEKTSKETAKDIKDKKEKQSKTKSLPKSGDTSDNNGVIGGSIVAMLGAILTAFGLRSRKQQ
ncbi:LPXTG cell wall anchor domain-containing protein, partial [Staphylococcus equorum]|uniref:LPXTG cell wall anchor domain-containing protein n=1 Tax=Staphylococcus equorum TaxID=246432 RepID=UPI00114C98D6